jgi:site-specific recombinase XerC
VSDAGDPAVKERAAARPTVKQHLAAIRMLFDWLIVGRVLAINPAHAVRGPKHVVKRGKTPVLTEEQARRLLESIRLKKVTLPDGSEAEVPRRPARPRADRRHGLHLRPYQRRRRHAR